MPSGNLELTTNHDLFTCVCLHEQRLSPTQFEKGDGDVAYDRGNKSSVNNARHVIYGQLIYESFGARVVHWLIEVSTRTYRLPSSSSQDLLTLNPSPFVFLTKSSKSNR